METKVKRREWVKTAAIIFLAVLLVLTFFSNTIMNRSLPEVAAQYVESGSINARIRGSGTISANEVYEVSLSQTRKIRSVLVKVGQQVNAGDTLFELEAMESEELKMAQEQLADMELNYQKNLITMSNASATEDRGIQKLRENYEEALRIYRIYSTMNPNDIEIALNDAQADLKEMQREQTAMDEALSDAQADLSDLKQEVADYLGRLDTIDTEIAELEMSLDSIESAMDVLTNDRSSHRTDYNKFEEFALGLHGTEASAWMETYANDRDSLANALIQTGHATASNAAGVAKTYSEVYDVLMTDVEQLSDLLDNAPDLTGVTALESMYSAVTSAAESQLTTTKQNLKLAQAESRKIAEAAEAVAAQEAVVEMLEERADRTKDAVSAQQEVVDRYSDASSAASSLKAAEEALEDALFEASLSDTQNLDMQDAREAIEAQKALIEELTVEADGQTVTANISGTISAINVTAGGTAGAEQPIASITVADRGYTISIPVTAEQARQVRIGDTAEITNYYFGGVTAILENIVNEPQSMGQNKVLIFRIEGEGVEPGSNLTLSIGQKSANYDCLVPNSAIRSDSNGSFVLAVVAKSSPLGNRYVATRVDVQVLASDDTKSAVSGLANGDFVITTSSKPIAAGDQVRMVDNG